MNNRIMQLMLFGSILLGLCPAFGQSTASIPISAPPELSRIIAEGLRNNQDIQAMEAETAAEKERIVSTGILPDPKVGVGALNMPADSFRFDEEAMTQKQIALEQTVPWLSKLRLKSDAIMHDAQLKQAELMAAKLSLARDIAEGYYEIGYVAQSQTINAKLMDMVRRIRRDAEDRYAVGEGLQQNIFQAGVELSRLKDEAIMLENQRQTLADRINALLNRETYQSIDPPENLPPPDFEINRGRLIKIAFSVNPKLKGLQIGIERARTDIELAEKAYFPDFNFRLAYGQRDEDFTSRDLPDFFTAAVMMDVPLWHQSKQSREMAAAGYQLQAAEKSYLGFKRRLPHQISSLVSKIKDNRQRFQLYSNELIPQAEQWARAALDAYEVGKVAFDTMMDARMQLLRYERKASRLKITVYQKRAALEALIGRPLPDGQ